MTRTNPATIDVDSLQDRIRENVRLLKVIRKLTDEQLATLGEYSSRQIVADRLSGRTPLGVTDVSRLAYALRVDPLMLQSNSGELMTWLNDHSDDETPPAKPAPVKRPARKK